MYVFMHMHIQSLGKSIARGPANTEWGAPVFRYIYTHTYMFTHIYMSYTIQKTWARRRRRTAAAFEAAAATCSTLLSPSPLSVLCACV